MGRKPKSDLPSNPVRKPPVSLETVEGLLERLRNYERKLTRSDRLLIFLHLRNLYWYATEPPPTTKKGRPLALSTLKQAAVALALIDHYGPITVKAAIDAAIGGGTSSDFERVGRACRKLRRSRRRYEIYLDLERVEAAAALLSRTPKRGNK